MILGAGQAPGKVILFGEHAVVYGRPALAVPVTQVQAAVTITAGAPGVGTTFWAADIQERITLREAPADHPLATAARLALARLNRDEPDWLLTIRSTIPVASGLGSGAAVSAGVVQAVADAAGARFSPQDVSDLVYEVEKIHHGTPSGIDNTVIAHRQPVYFVRGQPARPFSIARPFTLAIADTGIRSPTRLAVGDVRRRWEASPAAYEALFDRVAAIVEAAREAIASGQTDALGPLMDANQVLLVEMGVSCLELDALAAAARAAGALGAKLSGGGRGGNLIALVTDETAADVEAALRAAGAVKVILTRVGN